MVDLYLLPRGSSRVHTQWLYQFISSATVHGNNSFPSHRSLTAFVSLAFLLLAISNGLTGYLWFLICLSLIAIEAERFFFYLAFEFLPFLIKNLKTFCVYVFFCLYLRTLNVCSAYRDAQGLQLQAEHLTVESALQPIVGYFYSLGIRHLAPT